ncbi:MAG: hypothetical protein ACRDA3_16075 [Peptostreptococcaceae bacterium]
MKNKLKDNSGSAMMVSIFCVIIVSILGMYITKQIANQLKSSKNTYENKKIIYMSESGIEKAIYDIQNQIWDKIDNKLYLKNKVHNENDGCPKVYFDENGIPKVANGIWQGDGFANLIWNDIIQGKINLHSNYNTILFNNIRLIVGDGKANDLLNYYFKNIRDVVDNIMTQNNGLNYDHKKFESSINTFIGMMESLEIEIKNSNASSSDKNKAIDGFKEMISYMEEIKCRLNMYGSGETNPPDLDSILIDIHLPFYDVKVDSKNSILKFEDLNENNQDVNIKNGVAVYMDNGKIAEIDFTNLNNEINKKLIKSISYAYEVNQNIQFYFDKDKQSIKYNVISYEN